MVLNSRRRFEDKVRDRRQAIADGVQVIVTVNGTTYDYRFGSTDSPKLCER